MDYETESESIPGTPEIHDTIDDRVMRFLSNPLEYHIQHIFVNRNIFEVIDNRLPESFWDPVVVCLSEHQFSLVTNKLKKQDCVICNETKYNFKVVPCCKNDLCTCCASAWFGKSIKCPYCNQDIREFI
jgi:hypothetical protein